MEKKVLYIEDDEMESDGLKLLMERKVKDVKFIITKNSFSAIEELKKGIFDAIICDGHLLFGTHGREVIAFIKENQTDQLPKVIAHSSDALFVNECKEQGAKGCAKSLSSFDPIVNALCDVLNNKSI
jgi:DNA-binding NarL/FixJ family response regulator